MLGPLIWAAVLAQNDRHDLRSDRDNPRKASAPLVTGAVSEARLRWWYRAAALACVVAALFAAALYVPTTVTDMAADTGAGETTFAVRFGARVAYRIGVLLWGCALAVALVCAALDVVVPRSTLVPQLVTVPILLAGHAVLTRRPTIARMAVVSVLFAIPTVGFASAYIG